MPEKMTKSDFAADEKWQAWGSAFIANKGNIRRACDAAGISESIFYRHRRENEEFRAWLKDLWDEEFADGLAVHDAELIESAKTGTPLSVDDRATKKLYYERAGKLKQKIEHTGIPAQGTGEALPLELIKDLIEHEAEKKAREMVRERELAKRN
jgi:hypothetical protein